MIIEQQITARINAGSQAKINVRTVNIFGVLANITVKMPFLLICLTGFSLHCVSLFLYIAYIASTESKKGAN
jgi:hypothetical protein